MRIKAKQFYTKGHSNGEVIVADGNSGATIAYPQSQKGDTYPSNPVSGDTFFHLNDDLYYYYDANRNEWLSITTNIATRDLDLNNNNLLNVNALNITGNIIKINSGDTGTGVTLRYAGLEILRGSSNSFKFLFDENNDTFRIGDSATTQAIATREDSPTANYIPRWNNITKIWETTGAISINGNNVLRTYTVDYENYVTVDGHIPNKKYVDNNDISGYTAFSWGNHALAGYLTVNNLNLSSDILFYDTTAKTFKPYTTYNDNLSFYLGSTLPTGTTVLNLNGNLQTTTSKVNITTNNISFGNNNLLFVTSGIRNIVLGNDSMSGNTTGNNNVAIGYQTLIQNTSGISNIAIGSSALKSNIGGQSNIALGVTSLFYNTSGIRNIALGTSSMQYNISGIGNISIGVLSLTGNTYGSDTIAIGTNSLKNSNSSGKTIGIGASTGFLNQSGVSNIFIGYESGYNETGSNKLYISNSRTNNPLIFGDFLTSGLTINNELTIYGLTGITESLISVDTNGKLMISSGHSHGEYSITGHTHIASEIANLNTYLQSNILFYDSNITGYTAYSTYNDNLSFYLGSTLSTGITTLNLNGNLKTSTINSDVTLENVSFGYNLLPTINTGTRNIAIGYRILSGNTTGFRNIGIGYNSMNANTTGTINIGIGTSSLAFNINGTRNIGIGTSSLSGNTSGNDSVAIGSSALKSSNSIGRSVGIGANAGFLNSTGNTNIFIGYESGYNETGSNKLYISNSRTNRPLIFGDFLTSGLTINNELTIYGLTGSTERLISVDTNGKIKISSGHSHGEYSITGHTHTHSELTDLLLDNHTQYALLNGRSGDTLYVDNIYNYNTGFTIKSNSTIDLTIGNSNKINILSNKININDILSVNSGIEYEYTKLTSTTTLSNECIIYCDSSSDFTINLPQVSLSNKKFYRIKNINTGIITIDANNSELIDDLLTQILYQYDSIDIHCDGIKWNIL